MELVDGLEEWVNARFNPKILDMQKEAPAFELADVRVTRTDAERRVMAKDMYTRNVLVREAIVWVVAEIIGVIPLLVQSIF